MSFRYKALCIFFSIMLLSGCCMLWVSAEPEVTTSPFNTEAPIEPEPTTEAPTEPEPTTAEPTVPSTEAPLDTTATEPITTKSGIIITLTTVSTTVAIAPTQAQVENDNDDDGDYEDNPTSSPTTFDKTTRSTKATTRTTTQAKKITDYGREFRIAKWIALVFIFISIAGLVVVNVEYQNAKKKLLARRKRNTTGKDTSSSTDKSKKPRR